MLRVWALVVLLGVVHGLDYLSAQDKTDLQQVLSSGLGSQEVATQYHSLAGLKLLEQAPASTDSLCKAAQDGLAKASDLQSLFYAAKLASLISKCQASAPAKAQQMIKDAMAGDKAQDVYLASSASSDLRLPIDKAVLSAALVRAIKADDGVTSLSHAFLCAPFVEKAQMVPLFDKIEDMVGQADEVDDGKYLQFEGGLSVTATAIYSVYTLATAFGKVPPVKPDDAVKFASYLMNRKSVKTEKSAHLLLEAVKVMTNNQYLIPVSITLASPVSLSAAQPNVDVKVCNLLGQPLDASDLTVTVDTATHLASEGVVVNKAQMTKAEAGLYRLALVDAKKEKGFYSLVISAASAKDKRLTGATGKLTVKVVTEIAVLDANVAVFDREQSQPSNLNKVKYGSKLPSALDADNHNKMVVQFTVTEKGKPIKVHQAFVAFIHSTTQQELIFVAEPDKNLQYSCDLDFQNKMKEFDHVSGKYNVRVIVGDAVAANAIDWNLAELNLQLPSKPVRDQSQPEEEQVRYDKLPEIKHMFRQPEKRPPQAVSDAFTVACLAPGVLLLLLWLRIGINLGNMPLSLYTIGFHVGLVGIFGLYLVFWLQLNMFVTLKYLAGIGGFTFLCGNRMLRSMADARKAKTE